MPTLWIGTRKGAFSLAPGPGAGAPESCEALFGHIVHHIVADPRDPRRLLLAAKTGHLGPTVYRSTDAGSRWTESVRPPAFRKAAAGESARAVERVFFLTPGHASETGTWYAGTAPAGLFRTQDHGESWEPVAGLHEHPMFPKWAAGLATPDGELLHSILVDPRDARHLYCAISIGGVFESVDGGGDWTPLNEGCAADFLPDPDVPFGHDPHYVALHPRQPDRLYQQNHCGIYRLDRPARRWERIGRAMPPGVGDIGFPIVLHPQRADTAWVVPMDGTAVWPRTSVGGRPAVYVTRDAGASWERLDSGLPPQNAWLTVLRQSLCCSDETSPTLWFGTTGGEVWEGRDEGRHWQCIARHLPEIYSLGWSAAA